MNKKKLIVESFEGKSSYAINCLLEKNLQRIQQKLANFIIDALVNFYRKITKKKRK